MPSLIAVIHFYLIPPTDKTCPLKVISPVIDNSYRTGILSKSDNKQVTIATPADGPSFFIPAAGK
jgi:hypothetical protein